MDLSYSVIKPSINSPKGTAEQLVSYLHQNGYSKQDIIARYEEMLGEKNFGDITIKFNIQSGEVSTIEAGDKETGVQNNYFFLTNPIEDAISLIAKRELLRQLATLDDKKINAIVSKSASPSLAEADRMLVKLSMEFRAGGWNGLFKPAAITPSQKAVGDVLKTTGIGNITSLNAVEAMMKQIRTPDLQQKKQAEISSVPRA